MASDRKIVAFRADLVLKDLGFATGSAKLNKQL